MHIYFVKFVNLHFHSEKYVLFYKIYPSIFLYIFNRQRKYVYVQALT